MALRFQEKDDCDQATTGAGETAGLLIMLVLYAAIDGAFTFFRGESLSSYGKNLAWMTGISVLGWIVLPRYNEIRFRTKETYGKVSAIEEAVNASKGSHAELMERLAAVEGKLDAMRRENARR